MKSLFAAVAAVGMIVGADSVSALSLTTSYQGSGFPYGGGATDTVGFRIKGENSGREFYVGEGDLGAGNRSESEFDMSLPFLGDELSPQLIFGFDFSFDGASGLVETRVGAVNGESKTLSYTATPNSRVTDLQIFTKAANDVGVEWIRAIVNGEALTIPAYGTGDCEGQISTSERCLFDVAGLGSVSSLDVEGNFIMSSLNNPIGGGEQNVFELSAQVAPVPLPAAGWLLISVFGGLFAAARRRKTA